MDATALIDAVKRRPFEPFQLLLTTGERYAVPHPDVIMVGKRAAIVGFSDDPSSFLFDRSTKIDLLHIVAIEDLPASRSTRSRSDEVD